MYIRKIFPFLKRFRSANRLRYMRIFKFKYFFQSPPLQPKMLCVSSNARSLQCESQPVLIGTILLATGYVAYESQTEQKPPSEEPSAVDCKTQVQLSCVDSVETIIRLIYEISLLVLNVTSEYKGNLNEFMSIMKTFETAEKHSVTRTEWENAIAIVETKLAGSQEEFLDLIKIVMSINEVACTLSALSMLLESQVCAKLLFGNLNLLRMKIEEKLQEIIQMENQREQIKNNVMKNLKSRENELS